MQHNNSAKLAAFDIDGTLSTGVLSLALLEELVKRGLFSGQVLRFLQGIENDYAQGKLGREEMSELWLQTYLKEMTGKDSEQYVLAAQKVWETAKANTFSFVKPLLNELNNSGFTTLVISASPKEIVSCFCQDNYFSAERFRATSVKVDELGKYSGEAEIVLSLAKHKLEQLNDLVEKLYPEKQIDWENSLAMGDSFSDVEMLRAMGKPIVMKEANRTENDLVRIAKEKGWTVVDENNALEKITALIAE
ncbi:MAG: hypothetical protein COU63_03475 [Candidatus Pacebacteria bacterium CG10_big_fil_rev_8_21_14_0_10_36_11]|nr:HAD hydrolase family protein [Candidatus Pacearchaeota archaeon]OIP73915.1 MAG: hypothetical protein AUK08_05155 [Candidatus Pacebacteria bacterium CG2_30_36_39]PIR64524.1 MAG: hypothetical protein COU63_03475 [Candidatus Pacebacteria bacterium CG10_big_fil_rev_8_21_14_0_10_36_11]